MGRAIYSEFAQGGITGPCVITGPGVTVRTGSSKTTGEGFKFVAMTAKLEWDDRDASDWSWAIGGTDKNGNLFVVPSEDGKTPAKDPADEGVWPICNHLIPVDPNRDWQPYANSEFGMLLQSLAEAGFDLTELDENGLVALDGLSVILIQHEYEVNGKKRNCPIVDSIREDGGEKQAKRKVASASAAGKKTPASAKKPKTNGVEAASAGVVSDALREKAEELALELLSEFEGGLSAKDLGTKAFASKLARDSSISVGDKKAIRDLIVSEAAGFDGVVEDGGLLTLG